MNTTPSALQRRQIVAATLSMALPWAVLAAGFPSKIITMVVPYPAGGSTDTLGRLLAHALGQNLKQTVIIDNKGGAGTAIGAAAVAQAPADGYTLLLSSNTTFTINPGLKGRLPYDPIKSFEAIGLIGSSPLVLLANPSLPFNNVKDLVAYAKSHPGKLSYASFGNGTSSHFAGEMFKLMTGVDIVHVPYKGSAPAMQDLIGGQVELSFDINVAARPHVESGKVKALAVTSRKRTPSLPQVPTMAESGYPDYEMVPWLALVGPRGLPPEARQALSNALADVLAQPAVRVELEKIGIDIAFARGSAYEAKVSQELPLVRAYAQKAKISVD